MQQSGVRVELLGLDNKQCACSSISAANFDVNIFMQVGVVHVFVQFATEV
jgi:hypothetical protein